MTAWALADGLVAFACPQGVSDPGSWLDELLLMVLWHVYPQGVSDPGSWLDELLLMVL